MREIMGESLRRSDIDEAEAMEYSVEEARNLIDLIPDGDLTEWLAGALDKAQGDVGSGAKSKAVVLILITQNGGE